MELIQRIERFKETKAFKRYKYKLKSLLCDHEWDKEVEHAQGCHKCASIKFHGKVLSSHGYTGK